MFAGVSEWRLQVPDSACEGDFYTIKCLLAEGLWLWLKCARVWQPFSGQKMTEIHLGTQNSLKRTFIGKLANVENEINDEITDCFFKC